MKYVDGPQDTADLILKERDAYLAKVEAGGDATFRKLEGFFSYRPLSSFTSTSSAPGMTPQSWAISHSPGEAMDKGKQ